MHDETRADAKLLYLLFIVNNVQFYFFVLNIKAFAIYF